MIDLINAQPGQTNYFEIKENGKVYSIKFEFSESGNWVECCEKPIFIREGAKKNG